MTSISDHPLRLSLANELHARPAPVIPCPSVAVHLAIKPERNAAARDREADRAHLLALLERYGAAHPAPGATHHGATLGRHGLKWENHTEFATFTAFAPGLPARPFDPTGFDVFPADWLAGAPGVRVTSILFHIDRMPLVGEQPDAEAMGSALEGWFETDSLAVATILDGAAVAASDFRIDPAGHVRMAVFVHPRTSARRLGRIVQRLCEIETYKAMSMLGLFRARAVSQEMGALDARLSGLIDSLAGETLASEAALERLMAVSSELERLEAGASFRFGATRAYAALVEDRIEVLREDRLAGRQTLTEFMRRRYEPAMRTVRAAETRLATLSSRAMRAGQLLSTRVEVARSAQNQALLASMDQRADRQLRLQRTVEGLSVVAISYYAVGLASNVALPLAEPLGLSKTATAAVLTPLVLLGVWAMLRRLRRHLE